MPVEAKRIAAGRRREFGDMSEAAKNLDNAKAAAELAKGGAQKRCIRYAGGEEDGYMKEKSLCT